MSKSYKLRCTLLGHSLDVRGVGAGETEGGKPFIVSASRDKTAKVWIPSELGHFEVFQTCSGHTNFVSCVCIIPPSSKYPQGLIVTGSHDHTLLAFELGKPTPSFRLMGHKGTVCSIVSANENVLITGSWDMTAKLWTDQNNIVTFYGHEAAVWAVAVLPGTGMKVLTGSADKTIRLWGEDGETLTTFRGHTDCVRALAVLDGNRFLSGSNDSSIRLWSVADGETINVLYGHTNFIYSLSLINDAGDFASAGEDRTVRIWKGHECHQVIHLPATSIWTVAAMKNGDVIAGSSDGTVRVFTCEPERMASPAELAKFEEEVGATTIAAQQDLGGMKVSQLPGPEALLREGKKDGDTVMIREGSQVGCYSWSASEQKWTKVGDVVGASGATQSTSGKVLHDGKEYDYVFSVELDDQATLKLPYNINEDPWFAAKRFIDKNDLSPHFLDQVANFIITNTKGMHLGQSNDSNYVDPFTGGSRYVPGTSSSAGSGGGGGLDPFTGAGAYTTQSHASSIGAASNFESSNVWASTPAEPMETEPRVKSEKDEKDIKASEEARKRIVEDRQAKNKERDRVRAQIEADKQERRARSAAAAGLPPPTVNPSGPSVPAAKASASKESLDSAAKKDYTETKLQLRLPDGKTLVQTFGVNEPLSAVRNYIELNRTDGLSASSFNLMTTYPRKVFANEDYERPLSSLGLVPTAVLMVTK